MTHTVWPDLPLGLSAHVTANDPVLMIYHPDDSCLKYLLVKTSCVHCIAAVDGYVSFGEKDSIGTSFLVLAWRGCRDSIAPALKIYRSGKSLQLTSTPGFRSRLRF